MDARLFSALAGLIPAVLYGMATQPGAVAGLPWMAASLAAVTVGGLHVAWRTQA